MCWVLSHSQGGMILSFVVKGEVAECGGTDWLKVVCVWQWLDLLCGQLQQKCPTPCCCCRQLCLPLCIWLQAKLNFVISWCVLANPWERTHLFLSRVVDRGLEDYYITTTAHWSADNSTTGQDYSPVQMFHQQDTCVAELHWTGKLHVSGLWPYQAMCLCVCVSVRMKVIQITVDSIVSHVHYVPYLSFIVTCRLLLVTVKMC